MMDALLLIKRLDAPDEVRHFEKGSLSLVQVGPMAIARARYEPGWVWSEHVGAVEARQFCETDHIGMVETGKMMVRMADGREVVMQPGDLFAIGAGHDAWVVGNEPYSSLHFMGAEEYAAI